MYGNTCQTHKYWNDGIKKEITIIDEEFKSKKIDLDILLGNKIKCSYEHCCKYVVKTRMNNICAMCIKCTCGGKFKYIKSSKVDAYGCDVYCCIDNQYCHYIEGDEEQIIFFVLTITIAVNLKKMNIII